MMEWDDQKKKKRNEHSQQSQMLLSGRDPPSLVDGHSISKYMVFSS